MPIIAYIDMNAFFASCHQAENAKLRNKIIIVASASRRAVVCSASYQAREYGIKAGMPVYQAKNLCPQATYINIDRKLYLHYSQKIWDYLKNNFTTIVEQCSIDEYCLDITDIYQAYGTAIKCMTAVQQQLLTEFNLPCSIGIAFTKQLAKIASKLKKPQGISEITKKNIKTILWPLKIETINGIGPKTASKLKSLNIYTIKDLITFNNQKLLSHVFGKRSVAWLQQVQGTTKDKINFANKPQPKSIGRDITLEYDSNNEKYLAKILKTITQQVVRDAKSKNVEIKTIVCGFKIDRNHWVTKQVTISPINKPNTSMIYQIVLTLFAKIWTNQQAIRALRVALKIKL